MVKGAPGSVVVSGTVSVTEVYPPASEYFDDDGGVFPDWNALLIAANDITLGISVIGYKNKTIYFISDVQGTLTIQIREPNDTTWRDFDFLSITANFLRTYQMEEQTEQIRLTFDQAATVSAWYALGVK